MNNILGCNRLQIHYVFNDDSHTMNAVVFNKTQHEILALLNEFITKFDLKVEIETEPIENGSIRSWLSLKSGDTTIGTQLKIGIVLHLLTHVLWTPITTGFEELTKRSIDYIFENSEIRNLKEQVEIETLKAQLASLKKETQDQVTPINKNVVKKKTSNFYQVLNSYDKITQVSFYSARDDKSIISEFDIPREKFRYFIMDSDKLDPELDEHAIIEIISPVLKKGNYKWAGIYKGNRISFSMKSKEFQNMIQSKKIVFKNGFSIDCQLEICTKIDEEGKESPYKYNVLLVNSYYENENPIETPEGKKNRKKKENSKKQKTLFDD